MAGTFRRCTSGVLAWSILASSAATAATAAPPRVDPLVALSVFGTAQSRAFVCGAGTAAAATAGAAMVQPDAAQPNCVLPVVDAAAPVAEPVPATSVEVAPSTGTTVGALPLLVGLAAIVAIAAVVLKHDDDDGEINLPISA